MTGPTHVRHQKPSPAIPPAGDSLSPLTACIAALVLAAGVFAVYTPALNFQFVLDDHRFVGDPRLQSSGHIWEYFTNYVWAQVPGGPSSFYRPVFVLWLRLSFLLSGMSPWGCHLLSIAKHVSVAVLLGLLIWKLLRDRVAALIAGTLFALHPAQTESVAWITVPDPLMSAAVLGTLLHYLMHVDRNSTDNYSRLERSRKKSRKDLRGRSAGSSSATWLIASMATCLAGLMAKETAIVLPVMLFAMALITPLGNGGREDAAQGKSRIWNRVASAFRQTSPLLIVTAVYLLLRVNALKGQFSPPTQHLPWSTVLLSWPATLWFYVKVLLWPVKPRAFADPTLAHVFSVSGVLLPGLGVCCALAALVGACIWAWRKARHELPERDADNVARALVLGSLLLVLPILLALNLNALNPGDFLHGRYTYLPLTGLMLLLATGWHLLENNGRFVALSAAGLVAVAFSVLTVRQESAWKDDLTIFTVAHRNAPHNEPVAHNLANANVQVALGLDEADRCDEALPIFDQAIQQYPQDWFAWAGRGECLVKLHDLPRAEQALHRASELSHEPRVIDEWQEVRARMALSPATPDDVPDPGSSPVH